VRENLFARLSRREVACTSAAVAKRASRLFHAVLSGVWRDVRGGRGDARRRGGRVRAAVALVSNGRCAGVTGAYALSAHLTGMADVYLASAARVTGVDVSYVLHR